MVQFVVVGKSILSQIRGTKHDGFQKRQNDPIGTVAEKALELFEMADKVTQVRVKPGAKRTPTSCVPTLGTTG